MVIPAGSLKRLEMESDRFQQKWHFGSAVFWTVDAILDQSASRFQWENPNHPQERV
jgi:hypothetical protein